jgi:hypothetical protein
MISFNPSAATPLLLLMGVIASVGVHQLFLWLGRRRESYMSEHSDSQFSHSICPDCRDGVVKKQLEQWRARA